jgi:F0F1-type ATP synthase membrane subunit b/b'
LALAPINRDVEDAKKHLLETVWKNIEAKARYEQMIQNTKARQSLEAKKHESCGKEQGRLIADRSADQADPRQHVEKWLDDIVSYPLPHA